MPSTFPCLDLDGSRDRRPLLVLLGLPSSLSSSRRLLERLADGRRLLAVSPTRGAGEDEDPAQAGPSSWSELVAWLEARLDERAFERVDLLGWSFGGAWALQALARRPQRFARAVLAVSAARFRARERALLELLAALLRAPVDKELLEAGLLPMLFSPDLLHRPGAFSLLRMHLSKLSPSRAWWARLLDELRDHDVRADLPRMSMVELVIACEQDWLFPASESRLLAEALPAARLVELPSGHGVWFEAEDEFVELVLDAFDSPKSPHAPR